MNIIIEKKKMKRKIRTEILTFSLAEIVITKLLETIDNKRPIILLPIDYRLDNIESI